MIKEVVSLLMRFTLKKTGMFLMARISILILALFRD